MKKTTYYYGDITFGKFIPNDHLKDPVRLAIINRINVIRDFEQPEQAWQYYCDSDGAHESYVSVDAKDEDGVQYELVFNKSA